MVYILLVEDKALQKEAMHVLSKHRNLWSGSLNSIKSKRHVNEVKTRALAIC